MAAAAIPRRMVAGAGQDDVRRAGAPRSRCATRCLAENYGKVPVIWKITTSYARSFPPTNATNESITG